MAVEQRVPETLNPDPARAHLIDREHEVRPGLVSVILVNYKGAEDTITCLRAFDSIDWPKDRLELIVVDNDSQDGSAQTIAEACPHVRVLPSGGNLGFAGGCNFGVENATGRYVAFINNDARPGTGWVRAAVEEMERDPAVAAVASKVLNWDGTLIDYVDGSLTWYGMGYKREAEWVDDGAYETAKDVLFGTGAAMFVDAEYYRAIGGFDERFFMFYEDVDLGWRINLLGRKVRYVPGSVAYHKHHVTMKKFGNYRESYLLERNALLSLYKNYEDSTLAAALPAAIALAVRRGTARADVVTTTVPEDTAVGVPKMGLTGVYAVDYLREQIDSLHATRQWLQTERALTDKELFPLFRHAIEPAYPVEHYLKGHRDLVTSYGIDTVFAASPNVLVVTGEPLSTRLAGPAIRAWEMAAALSRTHSVRLVSTAGVKKVSDDRFDIIFAQAESLRAQTDWADVVIFQGFLLEGAPWLKDSDKILVADIYDPIHLEQLEQARDLGPERRREAITSATDVLNKQLVRADHFLCASQKQRAFWIGQLAGVGRIGPLSVTAEDSAASLVSVVPFGIQDDDPVQTEHGIRGVIPGIGMDDKVIVWGGGVYNWFDPLTLVRAVAGLAERHDDVRLYFMGMRHPNPGVPDMRIAWETKELSSRLGLTGTHVFFNSDWVPYHERQNVLMDADVGVSTHFEHIETAFSFRTRILDYLWTGLPVVATTGDSFGNVLDAEGIGRGVPPEDVAALEAALEELLYDDRAAAAARERVLAYAEQFRWATVLRPLIDFCADPHRARDLVLSSGTGDAIRAHEFPRRRPSLKGDLQLVADYMRAGGPKEVLRRARGRIRRQLGLQR
ncbi:MULTISPECIES: glycosyltransferase [unclassified Actinomyces]|uniref:glycosyltransferase n=1 Tax=unclassified Actinomyces TaxID=2609248 RepID=UPI002016D9D0|nr:MULTISPECIES: glycosyltransferase [unclassified Actinomyces]MCL3776995.1 glycosyltransferase [Actinomyces sp. AC-20-1]MCL3789050.1 glycosyltransferase [Actinomyces sp. 187325]MCL3791435.1 glycosyltransferase [Actinomyces sp. 186855]MCL3794034.1 glycosyltransferase [Actinomyces sp. 217892]